MGADCMDVRRMKAKSGFKRSLAGVAAGAIAALFSAQAMAEELLGQPTPGAIDLQRSAAPLKDDVIFFHNVILLPITTIISVFVLGLLLWIVIRYNKRSNPTPARWSHSTKIEIKSAIEAIYNMGKKKGDLIEVIGVNTCTIHGKTRKVRSKASMYPKEGKRASQKKAIVTLSAGQQLEDFGV